MAFKREYIENSLPELGKTSSPLDNERIVDDFNDAKTFDSIQVNQQYNSDSDSAQGRISTGAVIPCDMTVKLIRADSANWEIFITAFNSLSLTFFGIFLGVWISDSKQTIQTFSFLEKFATLFFLFISLILIIIWIVMKINQSKKGVKIPQEFLNKFEYK